MGAGAARPPVLGICDHGTPSPPTGAQDGHEVHNNARGKGNILTSMSLRHLPKPLYALSTSAPQASCALKL